MGQLLAMKLPLLFSWMAPDPVQRTVKVNVFLQGPLSTYSPRSLFFFIYAVS